MKLTLADIPVFKVALVVTLVALVSGCAEGPPAPVTLIPTTTYVAVPCPTVVLPPRPVLDISALTPTSTPADTLKAYVLSVQALQTYSKNLELLIGPYTKGP